MAKENKIGIARRFETEGKSVYINLANGSWQYIKDGADEVKELRCAVYVSEERFADIISRYNLIKKESDSREEGLNDLVDYGKREDYKKLGGRIFGIKKEGGLRRSSRVVEIKPSF